jgi:hypothetical protein
MMRSLLQPFWSYLTIVLTLFFSQHLLAEPLGLHGPARVGVVPKKPFVYLVPATGAAPLRFAARGLPAGLKLNPVSGIVTGQVNAALGNVDVIFSVKDSTGASTSRKYQLLVDENALMVTPPMGWNSWYVYGCNIDDQKIRHSADMMISTGMAAHGYNYVLIDDCWQSHRDEKTGEIIPKPGFPNMKALADYVHSKGLRIGIYTSPGDKTCGQHPGSRGHLPQDVATYARWGMDFVKYDWCMFHFGDPAAEQAMFKTEPAEYARMSKLLKESSRAIVLQICQYGKGDVWTWGAQAGGQLWRTNDDVADVWASIVRNGFNNMKLTRFQSPGHYNDLDMLMIGKSNWPAKLGNYHINQTAPRPTQLTRDEQYSHIALWSLMASPMIFSGDMNQIDPFTKSLLLNDEVLAVSQDPKVLPATFVQLQQRGQKPVIIRKMADGSLIVALFNLTNTHAPISVTLNELGLPNGPKKIRDIWQHTEGILKDNKIAWNVAPHGVAFFKVSELN